MKSDSKDLKNNFTYNLFLLFVFLTTFSALSFLGCDGILCKVKCSHCDWDLTCEWGDYEQSEDVIGGIINHETGRGSVTVRGVRKYLISKNSYSYTETKSTGNLILACTMSVTVDDVGSCSCKSFDECVEN